MNRINWSVAWKIAKPLLPVVLTALGIVGAQNAIPAVKRATDFTAPPIAAAAPAPVMVMDLPAIEAMQLRVLAALRQLPPAQLQPVIIDPKCSDFFLNDVNLTHRK
jgi:hypothetical protein